ncbi:MAG: N-acetylneuraminate synthase family protein [Alphaproteobacteria bacterium]|nr:N-acetylneuraminate synthase family protein [Alphaproteobacteria bacterium]
MRTPFFIAEASSNHGRDLSRALAFVDTAAEIGCDAVKFQLFRIARMFAPEILSRSEQHRAREAWELPLSHLPALAERCRERSIAFSCTPFYVEAVEELAPYVDFYKIASYEILVQPLLEACGRTGKPVVLSTGMASLEEIDAAVATLRASGCTDLTLLHCVSAYPTPVEQANLAAIDTLRTRTACPVGWSDHTRRPAVVWRAVQRWQAAAIEFHLDLDGDGAEYAAGHCWLPHEIAPVIAGVRESLLADGDGCKVSQPCEREDSNWRADPSDGMRPFKHVRLAWGRAA